MSEKNNVIISNVPWNKPLPNIDLDNKAFWDGLSEHKFLLWHCKTCGAWYWPKAYCNNHPNEPFATNLEWVESSGIGKIFAFNRHHWAFHPGVADEVPYVYAIVEMNEGPLISATLIGESPDDVHDVGQEVEIVYEDHPAEGFTMPRFRLTGN